MRIAGKLLLVLVVTIIMAMPVISFGNDYQLRAMEPSQRSFSQGEALTYLPFLAKSYYHANSIFPLGVQVGEVRDNSALSVIQQVGAGWARVALSWSTVEPSNTSPENFNWSAYDAGFVAAAEKGIQLLVNVTGNPSWAADSSCGPISPVNLQEYTSFLQALVSRYSQAPYDAHAWELYNEPDNTDINNRSWLGGCWGGKGKEYGDVLKAAYPAIKAADPQAQVAVGSLAYDWFTSQGGPFDERFLDDLVDPAKGNASAYFDLLGFHYYPAFRALWEPYGSDVIGKTTYLRNKLASYGTNKPMIVTEISMWSGSSHGGSDELQSDYVLQAYARGMAADLRFLIWFTLADYDDWGYGLVKQDLSLKPAYAAYKVLASMMRGYNYKGLFKVAGLQPAGVEGYTFGLPDGRERHMVWATTDSPVSLRFTASRILLTDKYGATTRLLDLADGSQDGRINVFVTGRPMYIDITP